MLSALHGALLTVGLNAFWRTIGPRARKPAARPTGLPQHFAQACHEHFQAPRLAGLGLDVAVTEARQAHLGLALLDPQLLRVLPALR